MKNYFILSICFIFIKPGMAQINIRPYEQVAVDFFAHYIIPNNHAELKYILFQEELETESSASLAFCMKLLPAEGDTIKWNTTKLNVPANSILQKKVWFLKKIFVPKKKKGILDVFKYYPQGGTIAVACLLRTSGMSYAYMFIIDAKTKKIVDTCRQSFT
ncbi:MAG: hypothetical protein AAF587_40655 [Bacteroidota bacterium]